jgi:O-antigen/teichoic acid export membrane protein
MRFPGGTLAKNTLLATFFNGIRLLAQAASLILLARLVGPTELGRFAGIAGMAISLGALSGLGLGLVMYQEAANRKSKLGAYWRITLATTVLCGSAISLVGVLFAVWLFDSGLSFGALSAIFLADVVFLPLIVNASNAMAAEERIGWAAGLPSAMALTRLLAIVAFWYSGVPKHIESYVSFYLVATIAIAIIGLATVHQVLRPLRDGVPITTDLLRRGFGFMTVWASGMSLGSLDKTIVLRYAGAETAGLYAPAYRAATLLAFPVQSMSMAAMPRLFQKFGGSKTHVGLVAALFFVTALYGVAAGGLLWAAAPLLPLMLGEGFAKAADGVRWLTLFVPCFALRSLGGSVLMAAGMKRIRAITEGSGLALMAGFGALLLSNGGLIAAAIMITMVEAAVAATHWLMIFRNRGTMIRPITGDSSSMAADDLLPAKPRSSP